MAVKNQNDLIVSVTAGVLALGTAAAFYFTKPEPETKPNPAPVVVNAAEIKAASVVYTNSISPSGANGGQAAGGGAPRSGFGGGAASAGGGAAPAGGGQARQRPGISATSGG